jgi:glycosyltransferase involved in cell wall biosynthesis
MLVMRGPRESCLAFYSKFKRFDITYVTASNSSFTPKVPNLSKNIKPLTLGYRPAWWIDPVYFIQKRITNLSWANVSGVDELVRDSDVINISDTYYFSDSQLAGLAKKYNKKLVIIIWTTIPNHISTRLPPYSWNVKKVVGDTDLFILRNKTAYKFTDSLGINRGKTVMIYKGVDLKHFYPKKNNPDRIVKILYIGIYHESKGIKDLINAFEKIHKDRYQVELHLAGRGGLEKYINKKSETLPIVNHGFVTYDKLGDLYRTADIFCSPSKEIKILGIKTWEEYFSYTLMEAQASGLPIVATNSGGIPEEVDSRNFLVGPGDVDDLYNSLKKLVVDKNLRKKLSVINRRRAEKMFNSEMQAEKTEEAIIRTFNLDKLR